VKKNCDVLAKIDIGKEVESLNASVAAAITLYELARK
jgi:tRNA G18 (ribose-2'-O)-methylase SpoU